MDLWGFVCTYPPGFGSSTSYENIATVPKYCYVQLLEPLTKECVH